MRRVIAGIVLCAAARASGAQQLRGVVRDSASARPIPGAVLVLLDSAGALLGRNITDENGRYTIALSRGIRSMRVRRIGFRPRDFVVPPLTSGIEELDVAMVSLPTLLEPVHVSASGCPRRADQGSALALLEQARAGVLTAVVTREANPGALVLLTFERRMDGTTDRITRMSVRIDSNPHGTRSFMATHAAADFARYGFVEDQPGSQLFNAPDADVLLDDGFVAAYCFRLASTGRDRPRQVSLAFSAARRRANRVDIEGTLWIDTAARALRDIEFRYVGLDRRIEEYHPSGSIGFREMPNGVVLLDRWRLRLIGALPDSTQPRVAPTTPLGTASPPPAVLLFAQESGGEVARARWPDGLAWTASLGKIRLHGETENGKPVAGASLRLAGTDYRATTDANGDAEFADLVPGPYAVHVADPRLAAIGATVETAVRFTAARDSMVRRRFIVPAAEDFAIKRCLADHGLGPRDTTWILGRATTPDGDPIAGRRVSVLREAAPNDWQPIGDVFTTGSDGIFDFCSRLTRGTPVRIRITGGGAPPLELERILDRQLTIVRATYPSGAP